MDSQYLGSGEVERAFASAPLWLTDVGPKPYAYPDFLLAVLVVFLWHEPLLVLVWFALK